MRYSWLLALILASPVQAADNLSCVWGAGIASCTYLENTNGGGAKIVRVPRPTSAEDVADAEAREAAWMKRCHPVVIPDQFGVGRYHYSAPGCEYGR
jgi:hypothetical protein